MPVTTLPAPVAANERSIQSRGRLMLAALGASSVRVSKASRSSSIPVPSMLSTATTGAFWRKLPSVFSSISMCASSASSSSTRPIWVRATTPWLIPSNSRIRRCSSDCGFHPSVAATTNMQASTPPTPASMFFINLMCPGTSIKESLRPDGRVVKAKPKSIVRPRFFSSASRSGSVPVRARTRVDLP